MKPYYKLLFLSALLSFACEGEYTEAEVAINLVYPLANETCEDATLTPTNVEVPFRWTIQGEFDGFTLVINDIERIEPITYNEENKEYQTTVPLTYRSQYNWRVVGKSVSDFRSEDRSFSTPTIFENNNYAPFPVIFDDPIVSTSQVIISWTAEDPDGASETDELRFEVYLDESDPPTTLRNSDNPRQTSITILNLERKKYFVRVVAIDPDGNSSSNSISFDGE